MSDPLVVYAYNVLFGDALLVEIPDGESRQWVLIDVGNVLTGEGGRDQSLLLALDDVIARTGGHVDLYIMSHEHLDHVQGLLHGANNGRELTIDTVWMTASSEPTYYDRHPNARRKKLELTAAMDAFEAVLGAEALPAGMAAMMALNSSRNTAACVDHIRSRTPNTHFLFRGSDLGGASPLHGAELRILAPEEDTSIYYGSPGAHLTPPDTPRQSAAAVPPRPPRGVDAGAFFELIDRLDRGLAESLFAIDKAANDTSLVVELTWRGKRLLFPGDAEQESWRMMRDHAALQPVDVLKVGHHGSQNATPSAEILDLVLPPHRAAEAVAILSTHPDTYPGVPDPATEDLVCARTREIFRTTTAEPGQPVVVTVAPAE